MATTLNNLRACQFCIVTGLKESDTLIAQRLMEMPIIEGAGIEVHGFAPLGDPMRIKIYDNVLALRKDEASLVEVELLDSI